jgi:mannose-6-phosphate isomerase-like protein (cupin superfamily)
VHKATEVYYIGSGEAVLHLGGKKMDVKAGSVAYIPAGVHYAFWVNARRNKKLTDY